MRKTFQIGRLRAAIICLPLYRQLISQYARLWARNRRTAKALARSESRHEKEIESLLSEKDREIRLLGEQNAALLTKIEIIQRETLDKILETYRLIGISYATREVDERIQNLRFKPFDDARREEQQQQQQEKGLYFTLGPEDRLAYDTEYEHHVQLGEAQGLDKAAIERAWRQNEGQIIESLQSNY